MIVPTYLNKCMGWIQTLWIKYTLMLYSGLDYEYVFSPATVFRKALNQMLSAKIGAVSLK